MSAQLSHRQIREAGGVICDQPFLIGGKTPWIEVRDGNATALSIFDRHYSSRRAHIRKINLFVGPGEKMVLLTPCVLAVFAWRRELYRMDGQIGINCSVFRNEGSGKSSELIEAADYLAWLRWPNERHYTFVDSREIRSSNPGFCFIKAGWQRCGTSKTGLHILERLA